MADTLPRLETINLPMTIDFEDIANLQDEEDTSLTIRHLILPDAKQKIHYDISTELVRPYIPEPFRYKAFNTIHNMFHPNKWRNVLSVRIFEKTFGTGLEPA